MKYKNWFAGLSVALVLAATISMGIFGFRPGIDFNGGTLWQLEFEKSVDAVALEHAAKADLGLENVLVTATGDRAFLVRTNELAEAKHQEALKALTVAFGPAKELRFESIGPAVGKELRSKALTAFFLVLFGISLYVAFAFRKVSHPVSSWKYGFVTLVTLFHDALIPAGAYAWLGHVKGLEIDTNFIVAILVIIGFSVHDTIVVFDRIRENLLVLKGRPLGFIINESINQTFARSLNTSLTLFIVLIAMYLFGATTLSYFVLTILIGTIIGTYSSIFLASPMLSYMQSKK